MNLEIYLDTKQFLSLLRHSARLIVLEAVAKGLLQTPQQTLQEFQQVVHPIRSIQCSCYQLVTPPASPIHPAPKLSHINPKKRPCDLLDDTTSTKLCNCSSQLNNTLPLVPLLSKDQATCRKCSAAF